MYIVGRRVNIARCAEVSLALIPVTLLGLLLFPLAASAAVGVGFALWEHLRVGDPFWRVDLTESGVLVGSSAGGIFGIIGLWMAVFRDPRTLPNQPLQWWATIVALGAGATTACCVLASGYWPWRNFLLTYPLIAASTVAMYRLPLLIIARVRGAARG
jgi:hypothetical protein